MYSRKWPHTWCRYKWLANGPDSCFLAITISDVHPCKKKHELRMQAFGVSFLRCMSWPNIWDRCHRGWQAASPSWKVIMCRSHSKFDNYGEHPKYIGCLLYFNGKLSIVVVICVIDIFLMVSPKKQTANHNIQWKLYMIDASTGNDNYTCLACPWRNEVMFSRALSCNVCSLGRGSPFALGQKGSLKPFLSEFICHMSDSLQTSTYLKFMPSQNHKQPP